ncbi:hypothetical protein OROGR_014076 [Orobanche gracilis]
MAADEEFVPANAAEQRKAAEDTNADEEHDAVVESEGEEEESGAEESGEEEALQEEVPEKRVNPNMDLKVKWKYIRPLESSGEEAVEGLRASAFGNYLKYKDHIAKSQKCICYVVSRQVEGVPDPDENAMWFKGWIYEALPEVGMEIGGLRGDYQGKWPRGLKFEYDQSYAKVDISEVHGVFEPTLTEELSDYYASVETEGSSFALKYILGYEKSKGRARRMENRQVSPPAEPSRRRASVDEIPHDAFTRTGDAESREDADVLAAAREPSSREEAEKVDVEKRKREVDAISEEVTKKVKAEIQSPEFIQMLANAIVSLLPGIASKGAGEREQQAGEEERGLFWEKSAGAGDNQAVSSDTNYGRVMEERVEKMKLVQTVTPPDPLREYYTPWLEQPLCSKLPNTQEIAAEFAWNYDIHQNVFGGDSPYSTQETQSSIPTKYGEKRNVGLPFAVGKDYFEYIKDVTKELEHMHMEPYVAILAKDPHIAKVHWVQNRFVAMGVQFQKAVEDVWKAMHGEKPDGWVPDHNTEEVITAEHMEQLEQFADGLLPEWGGLKKWIEAEKV